MRDIRILSMMMRDESVPATLSIFDDDIVVTTPMDLDENANDKLVKRLPSICCDWDSRCTTGRKRLTDELKPLATVEDTEAYLRHKVPVDLVDYEERKRGAASNVLRMMYRNQGDDLDKLVTEDPLTRQMVADIIGVSVAQDVNRKESMSESDTDLSAFKTFTQTAGGYSFTGEWRGNTDDVFFTSNQLKQLGVGRATIARFQL